MIIVILGILASSLGILLTGTRILNNLICECWPSWKKFERSIRYLENSHYLPNELKEMFLPFEEYFLKYIENKEEYIHLNKSRIKRFHLTESQIVVVDGDENVIAGPNFDDVVKAYRDEKRSGVKIIGAILLIVGLILTTYKTI